MCTVQRLQVHKVDFLLAAEFSRRQIDLLEQVVHGHHDFIKSLCKTPFGQGRDSFLTQPVVPYPEALVPQAAQEQNMHLKIENTNLHRSLRILQQEKHPRLTAMFTRP